MQIEHSTVFITGANLGIGLAPVLAAEMTQQVKAGLSAEQAVDWAAR